MQGCRRGRFDSPGEMVVFWVSQNEFETQGEGVQRWMGVWRGFGGVVGVWMRIWRDRGEGYD